MNRLTVIPLLCAAALALSACGNRGPLVLPEDAPPPMPAPATAPVAVPAPAPAVAPVPTEQPSSDTDRGPRAT